MAHQAVVHTSKRLMTVGVTVCIACHKGRLSTLSPVLGETLQKYNKQTASLGPVAGLLVNTQHLLTQAEDTSPSMSQGFIPLCLTCLSFFSPKQVPFK